MRSVKDNLQYIRIRLYLMASVPDFDEMVKQKVHLYLEHQFQKEIADRLNISKKRIPDLERVARAKLIALENEKDTEFYNQLAKDIVEKVEMDVVVSLENLGKLRFLWDMYS